MISNDFFVSNLMTEIRNPVEVVYNTNIKVVTEVNSNAIFMSRNPIPYPRESINFSYCKNIGVLTYNKEALEIFAILRKRKMNLLKTSMN